MWLDHQVLSYEILEINESAFRTHMRWCQTKKERQGFFLILLGTEVTVLMLISPGIFEPPGVNLYITSRVLGYNADIA